eukprot:CAMPEP_0197848712 /NCGR_PEP_ID=MMETSP1438-20131217/9728_1 /TAXON_ID=1461541 /ORGANISM="Pterosperma sp., Strain CCMP1384" /LENGTH=77 /DNA_ID=CAMNT_0043461089 /DNA_START=48 /DNA_END=281 /DNA_ORIENTATION=-
MAWLMGKGEGSPELWVAQILAGQISFEITSVWEELVKEGPKGRKLKLVEEDCNRSAWHDGGEGNTNEKAGVSSERQA